MKSTMFSLQTRDFLKGLIMAALIPVLLVIQQSIAAGDLVFDWKAIAMAAIAGFVGYLLKNFLTDDTKVAQKILQEAKAKEIKDAAETDRQVKNN